MNTHEQLGLAAGGEAPAGPGDPALTVTVLGKPAPQGSKRHVGGGRLIEQSKRVAPWREAVKEATIRCLEVRSLEVYGGTGQADLLRVDGPVAVEIDFVFDPPKSAPKRRRVWPVTRSSGDVDKLQRSTFDALTDAGAFRDDSQVVDVHARKVHTDDPAAPLRVPGAVIRIRSIT